jgi:hypothetical protein
LPVRIATPSITDRLNENSFSFAGFSNALACRRVEVAQETA